MYREGKRPSLAGFSTQHIDDHANLPEVKAVERFVHQQQRVRRKQSQRQHQPLAVALRE
jgi:hypothetical protein